MKPLSIIWDARGEKLYPVGTDQGLTSGSVVMIREIARGLADRGHTVHVVTNDLEWEERRADTLWYWGPQNHPTVANVVVVTHQIDPQTMTFQAEACILAHTGCTPYLGPDGSWANGVDAWPVFTEAHRALLLQYNPLIERERTFLTGLGVNIEEYDVHDGDIFLGGRHERVEKVPGRMFFSNDPMRGLLETLDIFDLVRDEVPDATLHVGYDFDAQFERVKFEHSWRAQYLMDCDRRMETTPGVTKLGPLSRADVIREELECQVHCYPSDPPGPGTQTHGILQLELAAAGAALVLSDVEAFPELFGECSVLLPVVGKYVPSWERRCQPGDYAFAVVELMKDESKRRDFVACGRALAERNTWDRVCDEWETMLETVLSKTREGVAVNVG